MLYSTVALQRWLVVVAGLRSFSIFLGIFKPDKFKIALLDKRPDLVTPIFGRLFATWTSVTCILCLLCAREPSNKGLYVATASSFAVADLFFLSEAFIFKTMAKGAITPFIVATTSLTWMALGYNTFVGGAGSSLSAAPKLEL